MLKVLFIQVGKHNPSFVKKGCDHYETILKKYCSLEVITLPEGDFSSDQRIDKERKRETERIQKVIPNGFKVIYLDVLGKFWDTHEFAEFTRDCQSGGEKLCFIIGGAYGVDPSLFSQVDLRLSCSRMTTSHQLIRLFFFEQLFRVLSINAGSKYHHD